MRFTCQKVTFIFVSFWLITRVHACNSSENLIHKIKTSENWIMWIRLSVIKITRNCFHSRRVKFVCAEWYLFILYLMYPKFFWSKLFFHFLDVSGKNTHFDEKKIEKKNSSFLTSDKIDVRQKLTFDISNWWRNLPCQFHLSFSKIDSRLLCENLSATSPNNKKSPCRAKIDTEFRKKLPAALKL